MLTVALDFLVVERRNCGVIASGGTLPQVTVGEQHVQPKPSGFSTNDVDGPVHVTNRKSVESESDVEPHLR